jgi:aldose 1-epimerase
MITISKENFGTVDSQEITQYTLKNANGMSVKIINYGGAITNIIFPDKNGNPGDVVLGFDSVEEYAGPGNPHFGCITGRFANRIKKGRFVIDGKTYQAGINNNGNMLHGGLKGFDKKIWAAEILQGYKLTLNYTSKDGEEGFPGNCRVEVVYTLRDDNALQIDYSATTDKPTIINLTNHSYFNLSAGTDDTILDHEIKVNADKYIPVDEEFIPTGEIKPVKGTVMDLNEPIRVGINVDKIPGGGYDHTYVLNKRSGGGPEPAAEVYHKASGRVVEVSTTEPGIQFYSGNMLTGKLKGKKGKVYPVRAGFCLEAQHFPDSPNQPSFPNTILRPGETYTQTTVYKFSTK